MLRVAVATPGAADQLNKVRAELVIAGELEDLAAEQRHLSKLKRRPIKRAWCAAQSDEQEGSYYFCEWLDRDECDYFRCADAVPDCPRCITGAGACLAGQMPRTEGTAGATQTTEGGTSPRPTPFSVSLGDVFELAPVPNLLDGALGDRSFQLDYQLRESSRRAEISGKGFAQTYLLFGGPGAGKTHYFKHILSSLLAHPARPGCLLLDPKGVLTSWLEKAVSAAKRDLAKDLVVLTAGSSRYAMNVLGNDLSPRELGRLLSEVVIAEAGAIDEGWQVLVTDLLEAAATVIATDEESHLTVDTLLAEILYRQRFKYSDGSETREYPIVITARRVADTSDNVDARIAADRITEFFETTEDRQRRFIRQIIERSLGEFVSEPWLYLSDPRSDGSSLYAQIMNEGRVVSVAVGQASPAFQRSLCTLVKSLFQQAVLARLSAGQNRGFFILACDEYAQVITEGISGLVSDSRFFSLSREAGCMSLLAIQSVATGRSRFSAAMRDRWEGILGNVTVKMFMRLNDVETAELGSSLAGTRHSFVPVISTGMSAAGTAVNEGVTLIEHPTVPSWYLTNRMPQGVALVHGTLDGVSVPVTYFTKSPEATSDRVGKST